MGLFTQKPQFNDEAPGLPGEPLDPETVAERLPDAAPTHIADITHLTDAAADVTSITIPFSTDIPPTDVPPTDIPPTDTAPAG